jgi:hypothetical protein
MRPRMERQRVVLLSGDRLQRASSAAERVPLASRVVAVAIALQSRSADGWQGLTVRTAFALVVGHVVGERARLTLVLMGLCLGKCMSTSASPAEGHVPYVCQLR